MKIIKTPENEFNRCARCGKYLTFEEEKEGYCDDCDRDDEFEHNEGIPESDIEW